MTRWFSPTSLQFSSSSWNQSRFRSKTIPSTKYRHVKHYRLLKEIAHGSTCIVYLALDTKSRKLYALKEMNLKRLQRQNHMDWLQARHPKHQQQHDGIKRRRIEPFSPILASANQIESDILHSLHHDNIVEWVDCFEDSNNLYLVTEWVDGSVLVDLHHEQTNESDNRQDFSAHSIFIQLVDVLDHLHERNIIHGDIKPDNVLLTKNKQIKLIDFGSAIKLNATDNNSKNNDDGIMKKAFHRRRTLAFLPPECIKKETTTAHHDIATVIHYETAADIWSLGMTLYCMVYGKLPFHYSTNSTNKQMDVYHLLQNFTTVPHNNSPTIDPQLCHLIDQMLNVSPLERITLKQIKRHPWYLGTTTTT
ncbi:kinase-like domain-containing protein [Absidia repens]|uniref:non-specific serine/threonine protein kinase n=1 Tax=Absidia repens TaxID=90262 RepID=A0A1X2IFI1_9FUNG|nr:kinase-like domain-containing protein [Absidia repens]